VQLLVELFGAVDHGAAVDARESVDDNINHFHLEGREQVLVIGLLHVVEVELEILLRDLHHLEQLLLREVGSERSLNGLVVILDHVEQLAAVCHRSNFVLFEEREDDAPEFEFERNLLADFHREVQIREHQLVVDVPRVHKQFPRIRPHFVSFRS